MAELLSKLDHRTAPELEPYREKSGQKLEVFLDQFEDYCKEHFKGNKYLWISELERKLNGKNAQRLSNLDYNVSYTETK